jgi:3-oxoacyl-[acyl-carrier protein] reductase
VTDRRVALVNDASFYVGPTLALALARSGHDVVVGDPADGLVDELRAVGAAVEVVEGVRSLRTEQHATRLVEAATGRFGRIDAAAVFSGQIVTGPFLSSNAEQLRTVFEGCVGAPYHFLRAVTPVMVEQGSGQILVITSAAGARPTPMAPLYSAMRAGATMLARNVAAEVVGAGVQVNALGTNFIDFPELLASAGATTPEGRARLESRVPMGRLGSLDELAASCMSFLDGSNTFVTGQFLAMAGGWA